VVENGRSGNIIFWEGTVYVITFVSQVIWQYKMDLFPVAVLGSRNYFVWQNCSGRAKRARSPEDLKFKL